MNDWSTLKKLIWLRIIKGGGAVLKTVTGSLIHITDALALPAEALTVNVEPIQAGSGDPSPDNVRPISGRTSATVTRCGKNLINPVPGKDSAFGLTFTVDNALIINGTNTTTAYTGSGITKENARYKLPAGTYTLSLITSPTDTNVSYINIELYSADGTWIRKVVYGGNKTPQTFTLAEPHVWDWWMAIAPGTYSNFSAKFQLELSSTATVYEPYAGNTYTIQLGQTVYGGQLDVTAGKMVVDRTMVDLGTLSFFKSSSTSAGGGSLFTIPVSSVGVGMAERVRNAPNTMISDAYKTAASDVWWANQTPDFGMSVNTNSLFVADSRYSTAADFRAAVSGVQLVYELATPFEITLTPTQIEMLLGENNVWADSGDSTLTYYADGNASTSEALGILLGGTYNNPGGAEDVSDDEALGILLGGS